MNLGKRRLLLGIIVINIALIGVGLVGSYTSQPKELKTIELEAGEVKAIPLDLGSGPLEVINPELNTSGSKYWALAMNKSLTVTAPPDAITGSYLLRVKGDKGYQDVEVNVSNPKYPAVYSLYIANPEITSQGLLLQVVNGGTMKETPQIKVTLEDEEGNSVGDVATHSIGTLYDHSSSKVLLKEFKNLPKGNYLVSVDLVGNKPVTLEFSIRKEE
jgi:hypothetical protein